MRRDIGRNPQKYLSNTPGGVQASASQPPVSAPPLETLLIVFNPGGMLCVSASIGRCKTQNNIHAGSVYTLRFFLSSAVQRYFPCRSV